MIKFFAIFMSILSPSISFALSKPEAICVEGAMKGKKSIELYEAKRDCSGITSLAVAICTAGVLQGKKIAVYEAKRDCSGIDSEAVAICIAGAVQSPHEKIEVYDAKRVCD